MFDMHNVTIECLQRELVQPNLTHCLNIAHHANRFNGYDGPEYNPNISTSDFCPLDEFDVADLTGGNVQFGRDEDDFEPEYDDSMDGDAASALASAGFGTDEDYGYFGGDE
jgi:hypothetical protein